MGRMPTPIRFGGRKRSQRAAAGRPLGVLVGRALAGGEGQEQPEYQRPYHLFSPIGPGPISLEASTDRVRLTGKALHFRAALAVQAMLVTGHWFCCPKFM